jgi:hypothetical protein
MSPEDQSPKGTSPGRWPWGVMGLKKAPKEMADLRRAYAAALKKIDQSTDIEGFTALRQAYESATYQMKNKAAIKAVNAALANPEPLLSTSPEEADAASADHAPAAVITTYDPPDPSPPPPPSQPDPATVLLNELTTPSIVIHLNDRILAALNNPVGLDPTVDEDLRRTIARMLRDQLVTSHDGTASLPSRLRPALQALDARYHWLSDYTAFRRDFWDNAAMLDALNFAAGIERVSRQPTYTQPRWAVAIWLQTALAWSGTWIIGVVLLVGATYFSSYPRSNPISVIGKYMAATVLASLVIVAVLTFTLGLAENLWRRARRAYERFEDRRALKAKGIEVAPENKPKWLRSMIYLGICVAIVVVIIQGS